MLHLSPRLLRRLRLCGTGLLVVVLGLAAAAQSAIRSVTADCAYLAAGQTGNGTVSFTLAPDAPKDARVRVTLLRGIDVPDKPKGPTGVQSEVALEQPVTGAAGARTVSFPLTTTGMSFGTVRPTAELLVGGQVQSTATGPAVPVGVRKRISLSGEWKIADVKVLEGDVPWRPKNWKLGAVPATVNLPGTLPFDGGFRGWVTLTREVSWPKDGDLQPRAFSIFGASDSAKVRVNDMALGETAPVEDMAVLSHWVEFHAPDQFKGLENEQKRMLLLATGNERVSLLPMPKALPAEGKAQIEMVIRGTSGAFMSLPIMQYGVKNDLHLELAPAVSISGVTFDTTKPGEKRRFTFALRVRNDSGAPFTGKLRACYGCYDGDMPYTGNCPASASAEQEVRIPVGESTVDVVRDEQPRFATCRATFLLVGKNERVLDAATQDYHTVVLEIRNRRDLYLNNERFIVKFQGSAGWDENSRMQLKLKGGNGFRGHGSLPSPVVAGLPSQSECINDRYKDGLLTSAGSALLASCEKCIFWNPNDTSNIDKAVHSIVQDLAQCPGLIEWEATNELHGEPPEARVAIQAAFHKYDPYHRPVMATKGSGEWEAEAHEGRVDGVDIVGCQYLLSKEGIDSVTAAITEQPLMSTEVNWNDATLYNDQRMFEQWLNKGICGSLFFDYSGNALDQPVALEPPADGDQRAPGYLIRDAQRAIYQDLTATAVRQADGKVLITLGNRMPYGESAIALTVWHLGKVAIPDLAPGDAAGVLLPADVNIDEHGHLALRVEYTTHAGLKHLLLLTPQVTTAPRGGNS